MSRRQGFTLIELLVVISIIALLIAILLPALRSARSAAQSALCKSNERQVGIAMMVYVNDYNDFLPPNENNKPDVNNSAFSAWATFIADDNYAWSRRYVDSNDVLVCPVGEPQRYEHPAYTYGSFTRKYRRLDDLGDEQRYPDNPHNQWLVADSALSANDLSQYWAITRSQLTTNNLHLRHQETANLLFVDGRVEAVQEEDILPDASGIVKLMDYHGYWPGYIK